MIQNCAFNLLSPFHKLINRRTQLAVDSIAERYLSAALRRTTAMATRNKSARMSQPGTSRPE